MYFDTSTFSGVISLELKTKISYYKISFSVIVGKIFKSTTSHVRIVFDQVQSESVKNP